MAQPELKTEPSELIMFNAPFNYAPQSQTVTVSNTTNGFYINSSGIAVPPSPTNYKYFLVLPKLTGQGVRTQLVPNNECYMAPGECKVFNLSTLVFNPILYMQDMQNDRLVLEYTEISAASFYAKIPNPISFMQTATCHRKIIPIKYNL